MSESARELTSPASRSGHPQDKIVIENLQKKFTWNSRGVDHEVLALNGINLSIREGEFLAVIGPSGCGKTTLLKTIGGLTSHDGGQVFIDGHAITGPGPDRSIVFQSFGLFPWKTVYDNIAFPLEISNIPKSEVRARTNEFLHMVGLGKFGESFPHQLSGGMQQRVGLARALATDPQILLMDEPFGAIDAQTREFMQEELMRIWSSKRKTVLFITHDLDEAVYLADRIVVLTRQPGTIRRVIDVDLPRPRWEYDVRGHDRFIAIRKEIWSMLRGDLVEEGREVGIDAIVSP